jgi:hypothetical protein
MFHTLESFKGNLSNIVRPNRFLVAINAPSFVDAVDTLMYYASSAVIPDRSFSEIEVKYYGMSLKIPASEIIQDLSITFIMDEGWEVRTFFEQWADGINDRVETSFKSKYKRLFDGANIKVHQLDSDGEAIASYEFRNVFLKTLDQVELSMDSTDSHSTFQAIFTYSYWVRISENGTTLESIPNLEVSLPSPIKYNPEKTPSPSLGGKSLGATLGTTLGSALPSLPKVPVSLSSVPESLTGTDTINNPDGSVNIKTRVGNPVDVSRLFQR